MATALKITQRRRSPSCGEEVIDKLIFPEVAVEQQPVQLLNFTIATFWRGPKREVTLQKLSQLHRPSAAEQIMSARCPKQSEEGGESCNSTFVNPEDVDTYQIHLIYFPASFGAVIICCAWAVACVVVSVCVITRKNLKPLVLCARKRNADKNDVHKNYFN